MRIQLVVASTLLLLLSSLVRADDLYLQIQLLDSVDAGPTTMPTTRPNTIDVQQGSVLTRVGPDQKFFAAITIGTRVVRLEGTLRSPNGAGFYPVQIKFMDATVGASAMQSVQQVSTSIVLGLDKEPIALAGFGPPGGTQHKVMIQLKSKLE